MGSDHETQVVSGDGAGGPAEAAAADEAASPVASSAAPSPEATDWDDPQPGSAPAGEEQSPLEPSVPAGEPEAPVGPASPPHGDPLTAPDPVPDEHPVPDEPAVPDEAREAPAATEHEGGVRGELDGLRAKAEKADEYLELAQRTKADFENYRRRAIREAAAAQERGIAKLAKELLPAVDNLDRALEAAEAAGEPAEGGNGASPLISGIKLVHADVIAALARVGIERFSPQGEPFDPQHHEAVAQAPLEGAASGTVVEVYQRGYRIGESVLRPARVVVAQ